MLLSGIHWILNWKTWHLFVRIRPRSYQRNQRSLECMGKQLAHDPDQWLKWPRSNWKRCVPVSRSSILRQALRKVRSQNHMREGHPLPCEQSSQISHNRQTRPCFSWRPGKRPQRNDRRGDQNPNLYPTCNFLSIVILNQKGHQYHWFCTKTLDNRRKRGCLRKSWKIG